MQEARSPFGMASGSCPEAVEAAVAVLERGGNAVDAAVAGAFVLGVAEPASSGLGGTTYLLARFADGRATAIDGSALLPFRIDPRRVMKARQRFALADEEEIAGYEFIAVPGTLAALALAAERHGSRPLAELLEPAIERAERGVPLPPAMVPAIVKYFKVIRNSEHLRFWVLIDGVTAPAVGERFCNPELARTLRTIADRGPAVFYRDAVARRIEWDVGWHGGFLRTDDLGALKASEREPLRGSYRGAEIIAFPPPGGGGAVIEALNILENFPSELLAGDGPERVRVLAEAFHIAVEDWGTFQGDPLLVTQPGALPHLSKDFAARRADLVRQRRPLAASDLAQAPSAWGLGGGTTPLIVADRFGNVVATSQTLGRLFGAKVLTPSLGFPYNSLIEGCDLSAIGRGRRHLPVPTLMAPTIVTVDGRFFMALGASGSSRVPPAVAMVVSGAIDRGLGVGRALASPRVLWNRASPERPIDLEIMPPAPPKLVEDLAALGYRNLNVIEYPAPYIPVGLLGAVSAVQFDPRSGDYVGGADSRRGGSILGPRL